MKLTHVLLLFVFAVGLSMGLQSSAAVVQGSVLIVRVNSEIARPTAEFFTRSVEEAKVGGARLIVYELNTLGGELGSVTDIMNTLNSSPVPVVVWVTPSGAVAWSGGVYILMSSHIAVMASGTTIGSAQPVGALGETLTEPKYINALSGMLRTMRSGTVVGELGLYLDRKASASVIADESCTLFYLPAKKLKEMESNAPEIASALHKFLAGILSERLIDTNDTLEALIHSL
jgi:CRP-like cAMP-binding protein